PRLRLHLSSLCFNDPPTREIYTLSLHTLFRSLWSAQEWERIRLGFRAPTMDDKWHALVEGDRLHLHRSWTGHGVYEADFAADGAGRRIVRARGEGAAEGRADAPGPFLELLIGMVVLKQGGDRALWKRFTELGGFAALNAPGPGLSGR